MHVYMHVCVHIYLHYICICIKVFSKSSINMEHKYEKWQLRESLDLGFSTELHIARVNI